MEEFSKIMGEAGRMVALPVFFLLAVAVGLSILLSRPASGGFSLTLPRQPLTRNDLYIALSLASVFYLIGLWRLETPQKAVFDECYHGRSGMEYLLGLNPTEWTHPPLGKLLIASSLKVWQGSFNPREGIYKPDNPFEKRAVIGWRFASLVAGALALVALYFLTRLMTGNRSAAVLASAMLACDGVFFVQSRIAMTNAFTVCFILVASIGAWQYRQTQKRPWLLLMGLGLACAVSTRWSTLFALGLIGLYLVVFEVGRLLKARASALGWLRSVGWFALSFLLLPALVYLACYIPFVLQGPGSAWSRLTNFSSDITFHGWGKVIEEQTNMWNYHTQLKASHGYASPWWSWPLVLRPTWYHFESTPVEGRITGIVAIGNVFLWWASAPALITAAILGVRERRSELGFCALLGLGLWLMWGVQKRPLIFMHYMLEAIPFVCIALSIFGLALWQKREAEESAGDLLLRRYVVGAWGLAIPLWFLFFYPILSALEVPGWFFRMHQWLGKFWI